MKSLLIAAAAAFALAGAASAQPAYDSSQGAAPSEYPVCSKPGQDRCMQHGAAHKAGVPHHHKGDHHKGKGKGAKGGQTSKDGERG